jgi:hypothetical protein
MLAYLESGQALLKGVFPPEVQLRGTKSSTHGVNPAPFRYRYNSVNFA